MVFPSIEGPFIEPHFCRVWEQVDGRLVGCYGTNPNHGHTFEEAKAEIVKYWQAVKEDTEFPPDEQPEDPQ